MARLTFRRPAAASRQPAAAVSPAIQAVDSGDIEVAVGPGWFESTFDLWHGLDVCEELVQPATLRAFDRQAQRRAPAGLLCAA